MRNTNSAAAMIAVLQILATDMWTNCRRNDGLVAGVSSVRLEIFINMFHFDAFFYSLLP